MRAYCYSTAILRHFQQRFRYLGLVRLRKASRDSDRARISNPRSLHIVMVTLESPPQFHAPMRSWDVQQTGPCASSLPPGHLLRGFALRGNRRDLRVRGRILGQEKLLQITLQKLHQSKYCSVQPHSWKIWNGKNVLYSARRELVQYSSFKEKPFPFSLRSDAEGFQINTFKKKKNFRLRNKLMRNTRANS